MDLFRRKCEEFGWEVPETFTVKTGKGKHYYYQYPSDGNKYGNCGKKETLGFDIRGIGGYVVAPGSIHDETGVEYKIINDCDPVPAPEWLKSLCRKMQPKLTLVSGKVTTYPVSECSVDLDAISITNETRQLILEGKPKGERSEAIMTVLNALAFAGLEDGQIYSIFENYPIGEKYREKGSAKTNWLQSQIEKARWFLSKSESQHVADNKDSPKLEVMTLSEMREYVAASPRAWVIGDGESCNVLPEGGGLLIAGESKTGKSMLRTELAIHLVMGDDAWGLTIPKPRRVLILQFENTPEIELVRTEKMLQGLGLDTFPDELLFSTPVRIDLGNHSNWESVLRLVERTKADVVIYDPLSSVHSVDENSNDQMRGILDKITNINRKTGSSAIVIHHFGKPSKDGHKDTKYRTRGASAITDWCDTEINLSSKKRDNKTLLDLTFKAVRCGPEIKPIQLERGQYLLHEVREEFSLFSSEEVKNLLISLGGRVDKQIDLINAIVAKTGCTHRTASEYLKNAVDKTIREFKGKGKGNPKGYCVI